MPRLPTIKGELAGAIRRGKADGRLGPEHRLDVARARLLAGFIVDEGTPRSAIAALDRRLDIVLGRLGFIVDVSGPTELDDWLAGLVADTELGAELDDELDEGPGAGAGSDPAEDHRPE